MIKIKIKKEVLLNRAILLFAFFPLIPNGVKGLPVIILLLIAIFNFKSHKINYKGFLINSSIFFLYLISFFLTENIDYGLKKIETSLSILIFPLIFFILIPPKGIANNIKIKFMKLFVVSTTFFSVITLFSILIDNKTEYYKDYYSNKFRIIVEGLPLIGQHPIYASIFIGLALIFIVLLVKKREFVFKGINKLYIILYIVLNSCILIMLSSRGVILSLIMLLFIYLLRTTVKAKNYRHGLRLFVMITIGASLLLIFNRRVNEMIRFDTYININTSYSNSLRVNIYNCAFIVIKESLLFGHGVGDAQDVLNSCFKEKNELLFVKSYNSHNQYLDLSIKLGLFGLLVFLIFLLYNFYMAISTSNEVLFYIVIFYSINFLTENILSRQSGVILFSFIINLMVLNHDKRNNSIKTSNKKIDYFT